MVDALKAADAAIAADPRDAAADLIADILRDPATEFTTRPRAVMRTADFMARIGEIRSMPKGWTDVFVPGADQLDGD